MPFKVFYSNVLTCSRREVISKSSWIYGPVCLQIDEASITNASAMFVSVEQQSASGTDLSHATMLSLLIQTPSRTAATERPQVRLVENRTKWSLPHPHRSGSGHSSLVHVLKMLEPVLVIVIKDYSFFQDYSFFFLLHYLIWFHQQCPANEKHLK